MAKNEIDKAVQSLITMTGKKVEIKKVWENASPNSVFRSQEIPYDIETADCDWIAMVIKLKTGTDRNSVSESIVYFRAGSNGELAISGTLSDRRGTGVRLATYGANKPKRYTISSGTYFNDLVNTNDDDVCKPVVMYTMKGVI